MPNWELFNSCIRCRDVFQISREKKNYRVNFDSFHSFSLLSIFVRHVDFYFCTFSVAPPSFLPRTCLMYDFKHACTWYTVQCCAISVIMRTVSSPKFILLFTVNWNQANKILQMWMKEVGDGLPVKCSNPVSWRGGCFQSCGPMTLCGALYPGGGTSACSVGFYSNLTKTWKAALHLHCASEKL